VSGPANKDMRLVDVVRRLASFEGQADIHAREPWTEDSEAVVVRGRFESARAIRQGLIGFLEIHMAREFLEGWFENLTERPSLSEQCATLIHYAKYDA